VRWVIEVCLRVFYCGLYGQLRSGAGDRTSRSTVCERLNAARVAQVPERSSPRVSVDSGQLVQARSVGRGRPGRSGSPTAIELQMRHVQRWKSRDRHAVEVAVNTAILKDTQPKSRSASAARAAPVRFHSSECSLQKASWIGGTRPKASGDSRCKRGEGSVRRADLSPHRRGSQANDPMCGLRLTSYRTRSWATSPDATRGPAS
jgi:hypothetical protein